jgi:hypothetical protein
MDINGGQSPNPNGSPAFPATAFTGPLLAGNVQHSDGSSGLAGVGETSGVANVGYAQMSQSAPIAATATLAVTSIVIPAQSQITDVQFLTTAAQAGATIGVGTTAGGTTAIAPATSGTLTAIGQLTLLPTTAPQVANWNNTGSVDVQITASFSATGAGKGVLTVAYLQGINNATP